MPTSQPRKQPTVTFLRTYRFRATEKDPIIDAVHTLFNDAGVSLQKIHERAGVATATVHNWFDGPTRRPQYATICATLRALGYDFQIVPFRTKINGHAVDASAPRIIHRKR
jgi:transcriptional regulator with XRE-family HTH domain